MSTEQWARRACYRDTKNLTASLSVCLEGIVNICHGQVRRFLISLPPYAVYGQVIDQCERVLCRNVLTPMPIMSLASPQGLVAFMQDPENAVNVSFRELANPILDRVLTHAAADQKFDCS